MGGLVSEAKSVLSKSTCQWPVTLALGRVSYVSRMCRLIFTSVQILLRKEEIRLSMGPVGQSSLVPKLW